VNAKLLISGLLAFALCWVVGCAEKQRHEIKPEALGGIEREQQVDELMAANKELEQGHLEKARELFEAFKVKHEFSPFYQKAQLGQARALEQMGLWSEAAGLFKNMVESTRTTQPEIAGEALYQSSYCYEALGDEARVLASLNDALRMGEALRPEVRWAEIPARMAASYNRMGRLTEAKKSLAEAESGIQKIRSTMGEKLGNKELSRIYLQMGSLSTNQLSFESFQSALETLKVVQTFALRSIEFNDPVYSTKALEGLKINYRDLYLQVQQVPFNSTLDVGAAKREQTERKTKMSAGLLMAIQLLRQSAMPANTSVQASDSNPLSAQLVDYLKDLEDKLVGFLNSRGTINELTPEALKIKSIKKNITIKSEPVFLNERK